MPLTAEFDGIAIGAVAGTQPILNKCRHIVDFKWRFPGNGLTGRSGPDILAVTIKRLTNLGTDRRQIGHLWFEVE